MLRSCRTGSARFANQYPSSTSPTPSARPRSARQRQRVTPTSRTSAPRRRRIAGCAAMSCAAVWLSRAPSSAEIDRHRRRRLRRHPPTADARRVGRATPGGQRRPEHDEVLGVAAGEAARLAEGAVDPLQAGPLHPGRSPARRRRSGSRACRRCRCTPAPRPPRRGGRSSAPASGSRGRRRRRRRRPRGAVSATAGSMPRRRRPPAPPSRRRRRPAQRSRSIVGRAFGDAWRATEQAQAPAVDGGPRGQGRHQIDAGGALADRDADEPRAPHDAHAVGDRQVGCAAGSASTDGVVPTR